MALTAAHEAVLLNTHLERSGTGLLDSSRATVLG
jgi:hypothetical protein